MEYRAQVKGRCQRHFIQKRPRGDRDFRQHSEHWVAEWLSGVGSESPFAKQGLHLVDVWVDWRVLSNSGMDE